MSNALATTTIEALETAGGNRWTKGEMDRIYFDAATWYRRAGGEKSVYEVKAAKLYVDVKTGTVHSTAPTRTGRNRAEEAAEALTEFVADIVALESFEVVEVDEAPAATVEANPQVEAIATAGEITIDTLEDVITDDAMAAIGLPREEIEYVRQVWLFPAAKGSPLPEPGNKNGIRHTITDLGGGWTLLCSFGSEVRMSNPWLKDFELEPVDGPSVLAAA